MTKKRKRLQDGMLQVRLDHETQVKLDAIVASRDDGKRDPPSKSEVIRSLIREARL